TARAAAPRSLPTLSWDAACDISNLRQPPLQRIESAERASPTVARLASLYPHAVTVHRKKSVSAPPETPARGLQFRCAFPHVRPEKHRLPHRAQSQTPEHTIPPAAKYAQPPSGPARGSRARGACALHPPCIAPPCPHWCHSRPGDRRPPPPRSVPLTGPLPPQASSPRCTSAAPDTACCCRNAGSQALPPAHAAPPHGHGPYAGAIPRGLRRLVSSSLNFESYSP